MHSSSLDSYHKSAICILLKSLSGALSLHFGKQLMVNLTADLKFDLGKTGVLNSFE